MVVPTRGIVLRSIKYGETSLISSIFTEVYGVQSYLIQGVRSAKTKTKKAGLLQPAMLLDIEADQKPQRNLQRIRDFSTAHIYRTVHEDIYSVEMNALTRARLLEWYIQFLHQHTQHLGVIRSLAVLKAVLH